MTGLFADPDSTKAPGRAKFQRGLQEGIWPDHIKETGAEGHSAQNTSNLGLG